MKSVSEIYQEAINPPLKQVEDKATEQASVEKRIWLSSSKTKELSQQLTNKLNSNLDSAMNLACQAQPDKDDLIRSLLQQAQILNQVNRILEGKTDKYE